MRHLKKKHDYLQFRCETVQSVVYTQTHEKNNRRKSKKFIPRQGITACEVRYLLLQYITFL